MHTFISMGDAANRLADETGITSPMARRVLIANLIEEGATAICESYWRMSIPRVQPRLEENWQAAPDDRGIPADFWRMQHADDIPITRDGTTPSGSWARWSCECSKFMTEVELTGYAAAERYPDFRDLAEYGSMPVSLQWGAIGVQIHTEDVERLVEAGQGSFSALLRRIDRRPQIRWGNLTKSDSMRVIARTIAYVANEAGMSEILHDRKALRELLQSVTTDASEQAAVSEGFVRQLQRLISVEVSKMVETDGAPGSPED